MTFSFIIPIPRMGILHRMADAWNTERAVRLVDQVCDALQELQRVVKRSRE